MDFLSIILSKIDSWYSEKTKKLPGSTYPIPAVYILAMKLSAWYLNRSFDKYQNKRIKTLNHCMKLAIGASKLGFMSDNEKSLLFALAGDLAMNVDLLGDAEKMYTACREYSEDSNLQAFAFEQISWIKNEQARLEAV